MRFVISSGHGKHVRGASGYIDEVDEARKVVESVASALRGIGEGCVTYHDDQSTSQSENLNRIVSFHNGQTRDYDVSVHFNAYQTTSKPMGCEVLYVSQSSLAARVSEDIADAGDFIDRGAKKRTDLAFLNNTNKPAILIETCFVDSKADTDLYAHHYGAICQAIAQSLSGKSVPAPEPPVPPDLEEPEPPDHEKPGRDYAFGVVQHVAPGDTLNIRASASSSAPIIGVANNQDRVTIVGSSGDWFKIEIVDEVEVYGWVSKKYVKVRGEVPGEAPGQWHENITATVFGMHGDEQPGAYGNYIDSKTRGVSFPYKWRDSPRPRITVIGPTGVAVETDVVDVGPWNTDDPDYVLGGARPLAETQYKNKTKAQNGQVPSNDAGIDLTEPIARELGISGKGKVKWQIVDEGVA